MESEQGIIALVAAKRRRLLANQKGALGTRVVQQGKAMA